MRFTPLYPREFGASLQNFIQPGLYTEVQAHQVVLL